MPQDKLRTETINARNRSRGILVALLIFFVALSLVWYFMAPNQRIALIEADTAEAEYISSIEPTYILLLGSDSRKGTALYTGNAYEEGQVDISADVLTLVRVDALDHVITFLTIPRDTLSVDSTVKISAWLEEGNPVPVVREVEKLTGVSIPYYAMVSFSGFEDLINGIGGITVDVPSEVTMLDPATGKEVRVSPGPKQNLDGSQALAVASAWDYSNELEPLRQAVVRSIEQAIIEKVSQGDEEFIRRAVTLFKSSVSSNLEDGLLIALALDYVENRDSYTVYAGSGPYQGTSTHKYGWVVNRDLETWALCMDVVNAGGDPNTVVVSLASGLS